MHGGFSCIASSSRAVLFSQNGVNFAVKRLPILRIVLCEVNKRRGVIRRSQLKEEEVLEEKGEKIEEREESEALQGSKHEEIIRKQECIGGTCTCIPTREDNIARRHIQQIQRSMKKLISGTSDLHHNNNTVLYHIDTLDEQDQNVWTVSQLHPRARIWRTTASKHGQR